MHNDSNYYLTRRAAFWDNWRSSLEHAIKQFNADSQGKFFDSDDKVNATTINKLLQAALFVAMKRYHSVLGQQIDALETQEAPE